MQHLMLRIIFVLKLCSITNSLKKERIKGMFCRYGNIKQIME
ncbi:hypothetical protein AAHE18_06G098200 [Arachis hypogaea]